MAAAAVLASPILSQLIDKLASGAWKELKLLRGVNKDIMKLQTKLSSLRDKLDDAETKSVADKDIRNWLTKLREAAFDAEDLLEDFHIQALKKVHGFFPTHNPILYRHSMGKKLKKLMKTMDEIVEEGNRFNLKEGTASEVLIEHHSGVVESEVYGRDEDKEKIVKFLLDEYNDKDVSVLSIVGLGGMGKTTLAKLIYNDEAAVKKYFDLQIWVSVSVNFDVKAIGSAIIECVTSANPVFSTMETLHRLLQKALGGKRFLLILDNVWIEDEDRAKWEGLKSSLRCGERGSKIVVTARSAVVARVTGSAVEYSLKGLSGDDCWSLFREKAFGPGGEKETPELVKIGKEILSKCGGLPLAAKSLGSLMASKRGEAGWRAIGDSGIWQLSEMEMRTVGLPVLKLSYDLMPAYLKQCFAYCSLFPKDHVFDVKRLIGLWIAEGFLQIEERMCAEDIGNQYFNSLLWRSFFQDARTNIYGNVIQCKMHDLVHDLACHVAGHNSSTIKICKELRNPHGCRYLSLIYDRTLIDVSNVSCEAKKLRSFILVEQTQPLSCNIKIINWDRLVRLKYLRVLDLSRSKICMLPSTICKLEHLRLLNLSGADIESIPTTITSLQYLSTINLSSCWKLRELPTGMSNMNNLKHLDISFCSHLTCLPPRLGRLSNLQTLSFFIVGEDDGHTIKELQHLNQIRGRLEIKGLDKVKNAMEAKEANLGAKVNLECLELGWE